MLKNQKSLFWIVSLLLLIITCVTYLQHVDSMGYYADDWYEIYGGEKFGSTRFFEIYASDRPFRGYLSSTLYDLFDSNILYYQILAIGLRWAGAVALLWGLLLIWNNKYLPITLISILYLLYPGFLEQPHAFNYQAQQFAMAAMLWSIALSIKYLQSKTLINKLLLFLGSALLSLFSVFLMEYYIGLEGYRFLLLIYLMLRESSEVWYKNLRKLFLTVLPFTLAPFIFVIWRLFLFDSSRYATDVERLYLNLIDNPRLIAVNFFRRFIVDLGEIFVDAWITPIKQLLPQLRTSEFLISFFLAILIMGGTILLISFLKTSPSEDNNKNYWARDMFIIGFLGAAICLIPINLAEKEVAFIVLNRFSFPSSIGISMFIIGVIFYFCSAHWRTIFTSIFIFFAVMTQYANNLRFASDWGETQKMWQEFAWRVPGLEQGTTLMGLYPGETQEGYSIWAPASLLYFTDSEEINLSAEVINDGTVKNLQTNAPYERNHRSFYFFHQYDKALIFSKPTSKSCLRLLNGNHPEISVYDKATIQFAATFSKLGQIINEDTLNDDKFKEIIGYEGDTNSWCYYYEKADLARQFHQWEEVTSLEQNVQKHNLKPYDVIEWMPFIEAYAYTGEYGYAGSLIDYVNKVPFYKESQCTYYKNLSEVNDPAIQAGNEFLKNVFCVDN